MERLRVEYEDTKLYMKLTEECRGWVVMCHSEGSAEGTGEGPDVLQITGVVMMQFRHFGSYI